MRTKVWFLIAYLFLLIFPTDAGAQSSEQPRLVVQTGHSNNISSVAFSPDGKILASASWDKAIKLWDVASGQELRTLAGHSRFVTSVAFNPDGKTLVSGSWDRTIKLWNVASGEELRSFTGHSDRVTAVAFSRDGKIIASGSWDRMIRLWNAGTGEELHRLAGHVDRVGSVAFSPDGSVLVSGSDDKTIRLWDVAGGHEVRTLTGHLDAVRTVAFSPDGRTIVSGSGDKTVKLWGATSGQELRTLTGHLKNVTSVGFSPDGKTLASSSDDKTVKLWQMPDGRELRTLTGLSQIVQSLAFSSDGETLATGSADKTLKLWQLPSGQELRTLAGHSSYVTSLAFSPDGKTLASGNWDKTVKLWQLAGAREIHTLAGDSRVGDSKSGHSGYVTAVAFSPDGKTIASGSYDKTVKVWDVAKQEVVMTLTGHSQIVQSVAFSPDGKTIASGSWDKSIKLWDVITGQNLRTLTGHTDIVGSVAFSPDGRTLASGSWDKTIKFWNVASGQELRTITGHSQGVQSVAFSPDGATLASGSNDKTIKIWQVANGQELRTLSGHSAAVYCIAFKPDGKTLASSSDDKTIRLWDLSVAQEPKTLGGQWSVSSVTFSPDGNTLATGGAGARVRLWNLTGEELSSLIALDKNDWAVVAPDGRFDASENALSLMHYAYGLEVINLEQLKDGYYEPFLLSKLFGFNKEPLRQVKPLKDISLYPEILERKLDEANARLTLRVKNRGGGIGPVLISVNGKTVIEDARDERLKANPFVPEAVITASLAGSSFLSGKKNEIAIITNNYDRATGKGYISSRGTKVVFVPQGPATPEIPALFAIVGGVSDYAGSGLDLTFASKDAEDFAAALKLGANRLFTVEKTHIKVLSTSKKEGITWPSKNNFKAAFAEVAKLAKPEDVLVIYLAGHGVSLGLNMDTYLYLTQEATSTTNESLSNPDVRETTAISSAELIDWLTQTEWVKGEKGIKALKQVMILDTCAAGAAAKSFTTERMLTSDQVRAIMRMKDRTGFHVLMGSAADAPSYEASQFGQGVLTYALLFGMSGAEGLRNKEFVDVQGLFQYAADRVPDFALEIGGVQKPTVASPKGTSFDVGQLNDDDRKLIPLAHVKPMIVRPRFSDAADVDDTLKLEKAVATLLREEMYLTGRSAGDGGFIFVDADEVKGGIRLIGKYTVEGNGVTMTLLLRRDKIDIDSYPVAATKEDLPAKVMEAVKAAIKKLR